MTGYYTRAEHIREVFKIMNVKSRSLWDRLILLKLHQKYYRNQRRTQRYIARLKSIGPES